MKSPSESEAAMLASLFPTSKIRKYLQPPSFDPSAECVALPGCGCSLNCFSGFTVSEVADARLSLSKAERDMPLLGKLYQPAERIKLFPSISKKSPPYLCREICEGAFCFGYGIGDFSLRALKKHLRNNGITPRVHGNNGKKPVHAHTRMDIFSVATFIHH